MVFLELHISPRAVRRNVFHGSGLLQLSGVCSDILERVKRRKAKLVRAWMSGWISRNLWPEKSASSVDRFGYGCRLLSLARGCANEARRCFRRRYNKLAPPSFFHVTIKHIVKSVKHEHIGL
jgi:hypothetical protein